MYIYSFVRHSYGEVIYNTLRKSVTKSYHNISLPLIIVHFLYHFILKLIEDPETRPGLCPAPSLDECEEKESAPDEKNPRECLIDQECDVGQKCCSDGCKLVCMALEIPKKEYVVLLLHKYEKQLLLKNSQTEKKTSVRDIILLNKWPHCKVFYSECSTKYGIRNENLISMIWKGEVSFPNPW